MTAASVPFAAKHFADLPNDAYVDVKVLMVLYGRCRASVWNDSALGRIPKPRKFSPGCTRWNVGEIRKSLAGDVTQ
ncbi:MAG: transcriptional regulator [Rhodocyclaceae bacterium]|nr:MAG: transcriptional regulator [Rhodocyclaceae bacterium]